MIIHKGFIRATNDFYYPISEILRIEPLSYEKTKIIFKDGAYSISPLGVIRAIDEISKNKE